MTATLKQPRRRVTSAQPSTAAPRVTQAHRHPISRWYLLPLVERVSFWLRDTRLHPVQVTWANGALGLSAAAWLALFPAWPAAAAVLVWAAWVCDRLDGALARQQRTATAWGAWLDANVDELLDVALHLGVACAAAHIAGWSVCWWLFAAFVAGKYLFAFGLWQEHCEPLSADDREVPTGGVSWRQRLYHLPGNADVRVHLLMAALLAASWSAVWLLAELALVAGYYNLRWLARYRLVARRLAEAR